MLFAKTVVALCTVAATVMAASCGQEKVYEWGRGRARHHMLMDGLRCKCDSSSTHQDEVWTENECSRLGKEIKWCYGAAENYCESGNSGTQFREDCAARGSDCSADSC